MAPARANEAESLARIHVEAIGGKLRLSLLNSLRVTGRVQIDGRQLNFQLIAQRPNKIRMETHASGRTLVQATDGVNPPWQLDPDANPPALKLIKGTEGREFSADAEFDDPLVDYANRGYTLDYAGEAKQDGRQLYRIFVTRRFVDSYTLLIDAETYFIVGKEAVRKTETGREIKIVTRYEDFRPVAGIIMPFRIVVEADGKRLHETVLTKVEPNAPVNPQGFVMPQTGSAQ